MKAASIGRNARVQAAEASVVNRRNRLTQMFRRFVFHVDETVEKDGKTAKQVYEERVDQLREAINQAHLSPESRRIMHQLLHDYSLRQLDTIGVNAKPFIPPMLVARSKSRRDENALQVARALQIWDEQFKQRVLTLPHDDVNATTLSGLICWSALSRAMLLDDRLLKCLFDTLRNPPQPLFIRSMGDRLAIPLRLSGSSVKRFNTIEAKEGEEPSNVRVHYFYPDGLTLALIDRRLRISKKAVSFGMTPFEAIRRALWDGKSPTGIRSLSQLCDHGFWLSDLRALPVGSEAIAECCMGHWDTLGLDPVSHDLALATPNPPQPCKDVVGLGSEAYEQQRRSTSGGGERLRKIILPRRENAQLKTALQEFVRSEDEDSIAYAMAHWFRFLLNIGRKPSTIETYYGRLGVRLTDAFGDAALSSLDATDFQLLYSAIIDEVSSPLNRVQIVERIHQFHTYCLREFRLPPLLEPLVGGSGQQLVRARHIPANALRAFIQHVMASTENSDIAEILGFAVLLASRGGLRIGEIVKLRIRDIEPSDDLSLFIVPNRYGPNKSHAARRQIPLGHLLNDVGRQRFINYLKRHSAIRSAQEPFLVNPADGSPLDPRKLSHIINTSMNAVLGGQGWTFHHLRHTAANNMLLALEQAYDLTEELAGWDVERTDRARAAILGDATAKQKRYLALASFMGHASPAQTFESYIHLVPQLVASRVGAQPVKPEAELYSAAGGQQLAWIKRKHDDDDFARGIARRLAADWIEPRKRRAEHQGLPAPASTTREFTHKDCFAALHLVEQGVAVEEVAARLDVDPAIIERVKARAEQLARLETQRGASRLFSADRLQRAMSGPVSFTPLLATRPRSPAERISADKVLDTMCRKLTDSALAWSLEYFLRHSHPQRGGLSFKRPDQLQRFLEPFLDSGWTSKMQLSGKTGNASNREWDDALAGEIRPSEVTTDVHPRGLVRLLLVPNHATKLERGSNEFRYVLHMLAIMQAKSES